MTIKYLFEANGRYYFQKRWPKDLLLAMKAAGKGVNDKQRLKVSAIPLASELALAVEQALERHNEYLSILRTSNVSEIEQIELRKKALVWLDHHRIQPGQWFNEFENDTPDVACSHLETTFFDAYDYERRANPETAFLTNDPIPKRSLSILVQDMAWKIATQERPDIQQNIHRFSDVWSLYVKERGSDSEEKRIQRMLAKERRRWEAFITCVGDRALTQENVTQSLMLYHRHLSEQDSLSPESRRRYMTPIKAAFNLFIEEHLLSITVKSPKVRRKKSDKRQAQERYTFSIAEQIAVLDVASDQTHPLYAPWKELFITIAIQSAAIAAELQRMPTTHLDFTNTPVIYFEGELKQASRKRVVPLTVRPQRIKELIDEIADGSGLLLGAEVSSWYESRISKSIGDIVKLVNPKAVPYSLRHSFKHAMDMASVPAETQALFGGWEDARINRSQHGYGKTGLEHEERLQKLFEVCAGVFRHLNTSEVAPGVPFLAMQQQRVNGVA